MALAEAGITLVTGLPTSMLVTCRAGWLEPFVASVNRARRVSAPRECRSAGAPDCRRAAGTQRDLAVPNTVIGRSQAAAAADFHQCRRVSRVRWARRQCRNRGSNRLPPSNRERAVPSTATPSSSPVISRLIDPFGVRRAGCPSRRRNERGNSALHVARATAEKQGRRARHPRTDRWSSWRHPRRHHVGMAGETDMLAGRCRGARTDYRLHRSADASP